jgi:CubicO group peptidase (beta-lactamase class C family)
MRWLFRFVFAVLALLIAAVAWLGIPATGAGLAAKTVCSGVFVAGRPLDEVIVRDVLKASALLRLVDIAVDAERRLVRGRMLWSRERAAMLLPGLGCVLDPTPLLLERVAAADPARAGAATSGKAGEGDGTAATPPWPMTDWRGIDRAALSAVVDQAFRNSGDAEGRNTRAVVILHDGRLVAERYGPGFDAATAQLGWSMSKTVLGLLVYMKLKEQEQTAALAAIEWVAPGKRPGWLQQWQSDERAAITLADLLFMRDGLDHVESYEPWSAVPRMLWGDGDVAGYAGSAPAQVAPGNRFRYLSATTNILSRLLRGQFESDLAYWAYPYQSVFQPIGAKSAVIEADASGTFVASSYLWATPRDWARIGQLLLDDGVHGTTRLFPAGWQAFASSPPALAEGADDPAALAYGAQVWLPGKAAGSSCGPDHGLPADTMLMSGHWGQLTAVIPSRRAVIVRLGMTTDRTRFDRCAFLRGVAESLPHAAAFPAATGASGASIAAGAGK